MKVAFSASNLLQIGSPEREPVEPDSDEPSDPAKNRAGRKTKLKGRSHKSRLNLARALARWSCPDTLGHLTLTYHKDYPRDSESLRLEKMAIQTALKRFGFHGIWSLEFQNRLEGYVPHFHNLIAHQGDIITAIENLVSWWEKRTNNFTGYGAEWTAGDTAKAAFYFALHSQKEDQTPRISVGRFWGYIDREKVIEQSPISQAATDISGREVIWLKRLYRRMTGSRGSLGEQGFSWFLPAIQHDRVLNFVNELVQNEEKCACKVKPMSDESEMSLGPLEIRGEFTKPTKKKRPSGGGSPPNLRSDSDQNSDPF